MTAHVPPALWVRALPIPLNTTGAKTATGRADGDGWGGSAVSMNGQDVCGGMGRRQRHAA